jgi:hypothetical protein
MACQGAVTAADVEHRARVRADELADHPPAISRDAVGGPDGPPVREGLRAWVVLRVLRRADLLSATPAQLESARKLA